MTARQSKRRQARTTQAQAWRTSEIDPQTQGAPASEIETGTLVAHFGVAVDIRLASGERRSVKVRRRSGHVVGDRVDVVGERLHRLARDTELRRRDAMGRTHVVAANLDVLGIVVAAVPASPSGFVDRALISALAANIEPFLVINKADLPATEELVARVRETWIDGPGGLDIPVFVVCAKHADAPELASGLQELRSFFANRSLDQPADQAVARPRRAAFVGTSGVGKSSLVNTLLPELALPVGEINSYSGLGRHTTTTATLHRLPDGGELIDTPGFRDFGLVDISVAQLAAFFPGFTELHQYQGACRFNDCRHDAEPDCAIKAAVAEGRLAPARWQRYRELLTELRQA
ncbi:Ribosome small subunit-stimulated GTPase EngC [Enhygromyxa salina]|uniref:Small ribosomal subunit biogenesis GTPase RsgA n=1 Tax=Enhygromyxa salina TaxID=215803 RepID=A0A0C1ZQ78_9BACT|nr:ribosome small subunit-dependent GTPase A [Enhygromyxa salina]KIG13143.1 Ribosome small subunit-stimulated GTPase EngC [Enhygromyxa salina]